jgi:hypothetical protein
MLSRLVARQVVVALPGARLVVVAVPGTRVGLRLSCGPVRFEIRCACRATYFEWWCCLTTADRVGFAVLFPRFSPAFFRSVSRASARLARRVCSVLPSRPPRRHVAALLLGAAFIRLAG